MMVSFTFQSMTMLIVLSFAYLLSIGREIIKKLYVKTFYKEPQYNLIYQFTYQSKSEIVVSRVRSKASGKL
jgi:hypothetical protein